MLYVKLKHCSLLFFYMYSFLKDYYSILIYTKIYTLTFHFTYTAKSVILLLTYTAFKEHSFLYIITNYGLFFFFFLNQMYSYKH